MLEINGLSKRYGSVVALDGATFVVRPGRLVEAWRASGREG
jgi:ABC-type sugar transport system ATPase subunit